MKRYLSRDIRLKYKNHITRAQRCGIPFLFTIEGWFSVWCESGKWLERGRRSHQYCMARFGDKGPYSKDNVRICTNAENHAEKWARPSHRTKISAATSALNRRRWQEPAYRAKRATYMRKLHTDPAYQATMRAVNADPEFQAKRTN